MFKLFREQDYVDDENGDFVKKFAVVGEVRVVLVKIFS